MNPSISQTKSTGWLRKITQDRSLTEVLSQNAKDITLPAIGMLIFLMIWSMAAPRVITSLGEFPGPAQVWSQFEGLVQEHQESRAKEVAFYERQEKRNADRVAKDPTYEPKIRDYTGKPTFFDQIGTSLITVLAGFGVATLIAVPVGIVIGLSSPLYTAANPLIQLFKPVSPLAWLPLVTMVVSAVYVSDDPMVSKSFLTSMITVTLCS
ncbi:MAG: ABC transporter permease, partial [Oceanospirillum sp.]|nr:ABC transporter permease [Oceanospirillum sp.]